VRCFVAGDIGEAGRRSLAGVIERLRPRIPGARWVEPGSIHLTLEFLGEQDEASVSRLASALEGLSDVPAVAADLAGLGSFPSMRGARVLWAGLRAEGGSLEALAGRVRGVSAALGLSGRDDKPFVGHLTLARFRRPADLAHVELGGQSRDTVVGRCVIDRVILIQSLLRPSGAEYRLVRVVPLTGAARA
jgi:2'-5' RNA ligase